MKTTDSKQPYCVIGAGSSGLAVAKNFKAAGIGFDCLERDDDVGGMWYSGAIVSSIYESAQTISSKPLTEYTDFPMPSDYPHFPDKAQIGEYFRSYARHFGLYGSIEFKKTVERIEPVEDGWSVDLADGEKRHYRGVVIANGHNWDPRRPSIPGEFEGEVLHSAEYKTPDVLVGRRVLVVGGGNSGCDIAVESAHHASATYHSTRRGYHYLPKFLFGLPVDQCGELLLRWRFPLWLRRFAAAVSIRVALGPPQRYGLPQPDHRLFESHPIINSQLHHCLGHGKIVPKPDVTELRGRSVRFADGSESEVDLIIYATGYRVSFPFIDREYLNWRGGRPDLYLNVFHPIRDDLFVVGLIQPDSGQWGLVDYQAQCVARFVSLLDSGGAKADRFRRRKSAEMPDLSGRIRFLDSPRHLLEVEHFTYRRRLQDLLREFS